MIGWFSFRTMATSRQSNVVAPRIGKSAHALPIAMVSASISVLMPWVSCLTIGSRTQRCHKLREGTELVGGERSTIHHQSQRAKRSEERNAGLEGQIVRPRMHRLNDGDIAQ